MAENGYTKKLLCLTFNLQWQFCMSENVLEKVKETVINLESSADVILFGSRARKDFHETSDWDFLVLVDGEVDSTRADTIRHALYEIEWETGEVISSIIKSREIWNNPNYSTVPLFKAVQKEGILL